MLLNDENERLKVLETATNATKGDSGLFAIPREGLSWEAFKKHCQSDALAQNKGNKAKAAKFLQLGYKAFLFRLEKYGFKLII